MFKLAVFTDEISQDLDIALSVAREFSCDAVEIRSVWDTGVQELTNEQIKVIKDKCAEAELAICCLGTPFYKCEIDDPGQIHAHHDILRRCCEVAHALETNLIRGFTFWRRGPAEEAWDRIIDNFEIPADILEQGNCRMVIENEASTYLGTGALTASFLDEIAHDHISAVWDPCNVLFDFDVQENPFPEGYRAIRKHITHVHVKDGERTGPDSAHCVCIGEGEVDYVSTFQALIEDGYEGYVSLETHWRPEDISQELMDRPGGGEYSKEAEYATRRCLERTHELIQKAQEAAGKP